MKLNSQGVRQAFDNGIALSARFIAQAMDSFARQPVVVVSGAANGVQISADDSDVFSAVQPFLLRNITADGNFLNGLQLTATNTAVQYVTVVNSSFSNNFQDGINVVESGGSKIFNKVDPTLIVNNGRDGYHFELTGGSLLQAELTNDTLDNNLRTIALAERWFGGAAELGDFVILGPRSGFGIAIVIGGRVVSGAEHAAGEIGRWPWADNTELHDALSSPAVWRRLTGKTKRASLPTDLHTALAGLADQRDDARTAIINDYAKVLASLHLLLDTHSYFLHGPLTALGEAFCSDTTNRIATLVPSLQNKPIRLSRSQLGDDAGALGAASLAMEKWAP